MQLYWLLMSALAPVIAGCVFVPPKSFIYQTKRFIFHPGPAPPSSYIFDVWYKQKHLYLKNLPNDQSWYFRYRKPLLMPVSKPKPKDKEKGPALDERRRRRWFSFFPRFIFPSYDASKSGKMPVPLIRFFLFSRLFSSSFPFMRSKSDGQLTDLHCAAINWISRNDCICGTSRMLEWMILRQLNKSELIILAFVLSLVLNFLSNQTNTEKRNEH